MKDLEGDVTMGQNRHILLLAAIQIVASYDSAGDQTATSTVSVLSAAPSIDGNIRSFQNEKYNRRL